MRVLCYHSFYNYKLGLQLTNICRLGYRTCIVLPGQPLMTRLQALHYYTETHLYGAQCRSFYWMQKLNWSWNEFKIKHLVHNKVRASSTVALNFSAIKAFCSALYLCFVREAIFSSNRSSKFGAVKIGSCSCARFIPRALSGAVDIVREIALLPRAPSYSVGCSICINLYLRHAKLVTFLDTALVTAIVGDALQSEIRDSSNSSKWRKSQPRSDERCQGPRYAFPRLLDLKESVLYRPICS
jgi:hypothetical protein